MKNKKLFQKVKNLNLPMGKYALFGGGPMSIRELKEANDLDIIVTDDLFKEYKNKNEWKVGVSANGSEYLSFEEIEIYRDWKPGDWNIVDLIKNAEIIDELPFVGLNDVIKWKKIYAREKDLRDVEIIENYLSKNKNKS